VAIVSARCERRFGLDLRPEREAVERGLARMGTAHFAGMEHFGSRDENTRSASLLEIDSALPQERSVASINCVLVTQLSGAL